jgi:hypothetical protein
MGRRFAGSPVRVPAKGFRRSLAHPNDMGASLIESLVAISARPTWNRLTVTRAPIDAASWIDVRALEAVFRDFPVNERVEGGDLGSAPSRVQKRRGLKKSLFDEQHRRKLSQVIAPVQPRVTTVAVL